MADVIIDKKKHRPATLELKGSNLNVGDATKDMSEYGLKCVSPGLPPLSAKMKTTVSMSNIIAAQQREIIQSRKENNEGQADDENVPEVQYDDIEIVNQKPQNQAKRTAQDEEDLSIPTAQTQKRLKRNHAPPPLNLGLAHKANKPTIRSAPIYNMNPTFHSSLPSQRHKQMKRRIPIASAKTGQFPPNIIMTPNGPARLIPTPQLRFAKRPGYAQGLYPMQHAIPKTASTLRNPANVGIPLTQHQLAKYQQQLVYQQEQWAKFKEYRDSNKVSHVTDVFEGDATRLAPVSSQPLSAQREFFNLDNSKNIRAQQLSAKSKKVKEGEEQDESDEEGPEVNAIEENAKPESDLATEDSSIRTELRISNSIFRFEFQKRGKSEEVSKERFLSHCAAAWDQYSKSQQ